MTTHYADDATLAYIVKLERELAEEARLSGMGSEREAKLMAERDRAVQYAEQLRAAVRAYLDAASDEDDFATLSELEALTAKGPEGEIRNG